MKPIFLSVFLLGTPVVACPVIVDAAGENQRLITQLSETTQYADAQKAVDAVWTYWHTAPDAQAQEWLDEGVERIRYSDLENAKLILSSLVEYCPQYAEGYNQLAFAQFLTNDFDTSEQTLQKALALEPNHFGVIAGLGLIEYKRGNLALAKIWISKAVKIHPFLNERFILEVEDDGDEL